VVCTSKVLAGTGKTLAGRCLQRTLLSMDSAGNTARVRDIKRIAGGAGFLSNGELVVTSIRARKLLKLVGGQLAELRRAIRRNFESSLTVAIILGSVQRLLIIGHNDAVWKAGALRHSFRASIGPRRVSWPFSRVWASFIKRIHSFESTQKGRALDSNFCYRAPSGRVCSWGPDRPTTLHQS
jgi:hypothetical protein